MTACNMEVRGDLVESVLSLYTLTWELNSVSTGKFHLAGLLSFFFEPGFLYAPLAILELAL